MRNHGFSLMEMLLVAAILVTGSAVAIPVTMRMVNSARGDSALVMTATFLETVRNRAVAERRNMVITFPEKQVIQIHRQEVPSNALTAVDSLRLEGLQEFKREGLPEPPDANYAADPDDSAYFDAVYFSTTNTPMMFTSDGSLIDSAGDPVNGTIFIVRPGNLETARAVTVWGTTGLVRTWKWRGSAWLQ